VKDAVNLVGGDVAVNPLILSEEQKARTLEAMVMLVSEPPKK
jgi:hypothetical protein